jgi:hypothetical protein
MNIKETAEVAAELTKAGQELIPELKTTVFYIATSVPIWGVAIVEADNEAQLFAILKLVTY